MTETTTRKLNLASLATFVFFACIGINYFYPFKFALLLEAISAIILAIYALV